MYSDLLDGLMTMAGTTFSPIGAALLFRDMYNNQLSSVHLDGANDDGWFDGPHYFDFQVAEPGTEVPFSSQDSKTVRVRPRWYRRVTGCLAWLLPVISRRPKRNPTRTGESTFLTYSRPVEARVIQADY